ncbi:uncharacterized protein MKZ38_005268 [Zalerion maritima]|uniref:Ribonucleases P/MRP subunit Pop8-like domain-containing protein n=1 Tax=Zalerion maritima TaxID=339359 RepID=A0AAD5RKM9_9PEZI|nr:uncharacterized protein MKZ38_005268 [Zalerion maritima]
MSTPMEISSTQLQQHPKSHTKSHDLVTSTIRSNTWGYAHLKMVPEGHINRLELDNLQAKSLCTSAFSQFLGISGTAISVDILKVANAELWVRLPGRDLSRFSAAVSAYRGSVISGNQYSLYIVACSEWLGALVSQEGQPSLWS